MTHDLFDEKVWDLWLYFVLPSSRCGAEWIVGMPLL